MKANLTRSVMLAIAVLSALWVISAKAADDVAFAVATNGNLYQIDLTTVTVTVIGPLGSSVSSGTFMEGLGLSPAPSVLYGTGSDGHFYSINTTTGAATFIGDTGKGDVEAIGFNNTTLLGVDHAQDPTTVFSINTSNGTTTYQVTLGPGPPGQTGHEYANVNAMAVAQDGKSIYIEVSTLANGAAISPSLFKVNLSNGSVTDIGTFTNTALGGGDPFNDSSNILTGITFTADGKLWGLSTNGTEWLIDPTNANVTSQCGGLLQPACPNPAWLDLVATPFSGPVPEPAAIYLLGSGLVGIAGWIKGRNRSISN